MGHPVNVVLLLVAAVFQTGFADFGVDVNTAISKDAWECLKRNITFALVRVHQDDGKVDPNGADTIQNARAAGINDLDGYVFPCPKCGDPRGQIKMTIKYLKDRYVRLDRLWIEVADKTVWTNNKDENLKFLKEMVNQTKDETLGGRKLKVGIHASADEWQQIMGTSQDFEDLPLWEACHDEEPNFNDFKEFGGWTKPTLKQYTDTIKDCYVAVNRNWRP